jgi:hypothetical protein
MGDETIDFQMQMNRQMLLLIIIFSLLSCKQKIESTNINQSTIDTPTIKTIDSLRDTATGIQNSFPKFNYPDSSINSKIFLENDISDLIPMETKLVERIRESAVYILCNKSQKEYLLLYQYEGDTKNAFACFEIGYLKDEKTLYSHNYQPLNEEYFLTESGLKLGLSIDSLIKIKGKDFHLLQDSIIRYSLDINNEFVKRYNSPGYFIEAKIKNKKIARLKLGFDYP